MSELIRLRSEALTKSGFPKTEKSFVNCFCSGYGHGAADIMRIVSEFVDEETKLGNPANALARLCQRLIEVQK